MITNIRGQLGGKHRIIDRHAPAKLGCLARLGARARRRTKQATVLANKESLERQEKLEQEWRYFYFYGRTYGRTGDIPSLQPYMHMDVPPAGEIRPEDLPRYSLLNTGDGSNTCMVTWHTYVNTDQ